MPELAIAVGLLIVFLLGYNLGVRRGQVLGMREEGMRHVDPSSSLEYNCGNCLNGRELDSNRVYCLSDSMAHSKKDYCYGHRKWREIR
jgi:hypothetical protein